MAEKKTKRLKALFQRPETVLMPFGCLPIHAQMAERAGFEAFEISGSMAAWWAYGYSDVGLLTLTEMAEHAARVARSVDIPVYCDADTGYGGPANVRRTVQEFIHAGVAGIHIEDQREPKKAGNQSGIDLVPEHEAIGRLNAACDARDELDEDFVIVARTDGYGARGGGLDEAIRRGRLYCAETGADVIFYEGLSSWAQVRTALAETPRTAYCLPAPSTIGRRPLLSDLSDMGQAIDILPFIISGVTEPWRVLLDVREAGEYGPMDDFFESLSRNAGTPYSIGWGEVFAKPTYDEVRRMEEKYLPADQQRDYANSLNSSETVA